VGDKTILAMKYLTFSHLANSGVLGLAAGAGFAGSSLFTESISERAIAAGMTAALSSVLLTSSQTGNIRASDTIIRLGSLSWSLEDFCRNWLITGRTGSGKTAAGIANIMAQLFARVPGWGGLCIDQKGLFYRMLLKMASHFGREDDVILLQVRPDGAPATWKPRYVFNWLENPLIPGSSYAQLLTDVAQARGAVGSGGSSDHFTQQGKLHIGMAIDAIRLIGEIPTLPNVYEFLTSHQQMTTQMGKLRALDTSAAVVFFNHFTEKFLALAEEELSGVRSTVLNILFFYQHPDIAAVFGQPHSTVDLSMTDQGKIFCCSIPQRFDAERGFLNTLMKIAWYAHIKSRFNLTDGQLAARNLNVLWADEAQRVVTKSELGMADHNQVDQIREAKGCAIFSTQTERSFVPPLGRDIKNTLVDNLSNEIAFCQTNQEDAEILAKRIGERTLEKTSRSVSRQSNGFSTSRSYQEKEEPFLKPHVLRNLKKTGSGSECIIRHCEKGFQRAVLPFTNFTQRMTGPSSANLVAAEGQPYANDIAAKLEDARSTLALDKSQAIS
jgi:hypothetical protein